MCPGRETKIGHQTLTPVVMMTMKMNKERAIEIQSSLEITKKTWGKQKEALRVMVCAEN